ncbi:MAG: cbb3-type cytochrome c oxidase subunit 3 [Hyphomonadaceae bacterium]
MTYEQAAHFAQTWGLALLLILSAVVLAYTFWPGNREKFERAAATPLNNEDDDGRQN